MLSRIFFSEQSLCKLALDRPKVRHPTSAEGLNVLLSFLKAKYFFIKCNTFEYVFSHYFIWLHKWKGFNDICASLNVSECSTIPFNSLMKIMSKSVRIIKCNNLLCQVNVSCQLHNQSKDNRYKTSNALE